MDAGDRVVALVSGGADSACLAAGLAAALGPAAVRALHLNYALREDSGEDEAAAREVCERLGIELEVQRPTLGEGNLQAAAREARYAAAEAARARTGADLIATGHTLTDLAETVIYRLASSPGRRALLGLAPRRGALIRPLLGISREQARELAEGEELPFRDDPTNEQPLYARNRIRAEVLPVLRELAPAAEETIAATWAELTEEAEALEALAAEELDRAGAKSGAVAVSAAELLRLAPAIRRLALRQLAERVAPGPVALGPAKAAEIMRLSGEPEGGAVELGGGVEAVIEHGHIRFNAGVDARPEETVLPVPGRCTFGSWELRAELIEGQPRPVPAGPEVAALDATKLGKELLVRTWDEGDSIRPLGLDGRKKLQDVFSDAKVPRSLRRQLPVLVAGGRIAWVAGVAVSDEFKLEPQTSRSAVLSASYA